MNFLYYLFLILIAIFSIFGFLILIEYLRFWKRLFVLKLKLKFKKEVKSDD